MNLSSPVILLLFMIMGGLIAYLGDWLGRKMGKKRLKLWGLRPRHTATFFTVTMGMLIPILTTYAIMTVSAPVRNWLTRGPELIREQQTLLAEREQLSTENRRRQLANTQLTSENRKRENENKQLAKQRDALSTQAKQAESQRAAAASKLAAAERREAQVNKRVVQLANRERELSKSVAARTEELKTASEDLAKSRLEVAALRKDRDDLMEDTVALARQAAEEAKRAEEARKEKTRAESDLRTTYDRLLDVRQEYDRLQRQLRGLSAGLEAVRNTELLFRKGEELARLTINGGVSEDAAEDLIHQLVKIADLAARERGVRPDPSGRAAAMEDKQRVLPDGRMMTITVQDQLDAFKRAISGTKQDIVVIASAFYNYFSGEELFVPLEINMFLNRQVYKQGDEVAETIVDGALTEDEILDAIIEFLRMKVRGSAAAAGMIPIYGHEGSLGEIGFEQVASLVRQLKAAAKPMKVKALAAKATKSAEPLMLKFKVE